MTLKLKRLATALLSVLLVMSIAMSLAFYTNAGKTTVNADVIEEEIVAQNSYVVNQTSSFPTSITVEYGGKQITASGGTITYPNGVTYTIVANLSYVLDTLGEYTLKYFADGLVVCDYFTVTDKLYSLSDTAGNSISEFILDDSNRDIYYHNYSSDVSVARGTYSSKVDPTKGNDKQSEYADALIVKMKQGVEFNYAEPINLNDVSEDGLSNVISFSMMISDFYDEDGKHYSVSEKISAVKYVVNSAYVTLTDAYDPSRYIQVLMSWESESLYARVSTNEMSSQSLSVGSLGSINADYKREVYYGSQRAVVQTDRYGVDCGIKPNMKGHKSKIHIRYDNDLGIVYWGYEKKANIKGGTTSYNDLKNIDHNLIMDIKDPAVTGGSVFPGFTTGEVYVSVHFGDALINDAARVDIYSIGNKNAGDIINAPKDYVDEVEPTIMIDANSTINNGVYAKVGTNFVIPSAKAYDVNLKGDVAVNVYRNYGASTVSSVEVKNNQFLINNKDIYYVVYSATDYYGNVAEKVLKVYGVDKNVITFDNADVLDRVSDNIRIMDSTLLPLGQKMSTLNLHDELKLKIEFISEKESFVYADLKNGAEVDAFWLEQHYFTTTYAGEYTLRFTYSDNAVEYVSEETFIAQSNPDVVTFSDKPFIPRILLKDAVYDFATVNAFGYNTGSPKLLGKAQLQISFDGGAFKPLSELSTDVRKIKITGSKTAQLKAVYNNNEILSDVAIIKNVNYAYAQSKSGAGLNGAAYFHYENNAFRIPEKYEDELIFVSNNNAQTNKIQFANTVSIKNFQLIYQIPKDYSNYDKLTFVFTDPYNTNNVLTISMYKKMGAVYYSYNGVEVKSASKFGSDSELILSYHEFSGSLNLPDVSGTRSTGIEFTTPLVYFDIVLEGIRGQAGVLISSINTQTLYQTMRDRVAPELISNTLTGQFGIGETITLPGAQFVDLLSIVEYDAFSTHFTLNDTQFQTSVDGVRLDGVKNDPTVSYKVKLKTAGYYYYNYLVADAFGNGDSGVIGYIDPVDKQAPTIKFTGSIKEDDTVTVLVGSSITLQYSLSDNSTPTNKLSSNIIMRDCINSIYYPVSSKTITFDKVGRYEISIVCQDLANNITMKSFMVVVLQELPNETV